MLVVRHEVSLLSLKDLSGEHLDYQMCLHVQLPVSERTQEPIARSDGRSEKAMEVPARPARARRARYGAVGGVVPLPADLSGTSTVLPSASL
jgi:hypothetical protein